MIERLLIINGSMEYPIITNDDNSCSLICPQLITSEGYTVREAIIIGISTKQVKCALGYNCHSTNY